MPKTPLHTLIWSQDHAHYELSTQGQRERIFSPEDTDAWLSWLTTATSFTFRGVAGRLNVYQEARGETSHYWYAYHTTGKRTRKRYLGLPAMVTFARLEAVASVLDQGGSAQDTPSPDAMLDMSLLSTNLVHPQLRSTLVVRERLLTQLDAAYSHRLTLLAASAGWGKTTLISMWAARSRFPVAWLSLSELDNEPTRFWISVLAALRTCLPGVGKTALAMLRSPQPQPLTAILLALLQEFEGLTQPLALIVDDYHLMEDPAIHDSLLFLLERLPMHFHLVLASRVDPPLALARFRVRGQLLELRDANLRFQDDEATCFFVQDMNLSLLPEEVTLLLQRTEGWAAGLQLAALSMHKHEDLSAFVQSFAGSHRHVLDYVQEEIVARLPTALQRFLPQIAILNKISAPVCQVITGEAESWT